jgi:3-oxoadipate enol-lactonase
MYTTINGIRLYYQVEGQPQGPGLVFINSLGCDLHIWDRVAPSFNERYQVLRYDKRGHGRSDVPAGPYTIRDHSSDLASLLQALGIESAALVGISVGGLIAMDFALQHPEQPRSLILSDTAPKIGTTEGWEERIRLVREQGMSAIAETIASRWFTPVFKEGSPSEYHGYLEMLSHTSPEGYAATCAALRDADLRAAVPAIAAPALALVGAADQTVTPEATHTWAARLPNARVTVIENAAHLPCIEQPGAVVEAIQGFFEEVNDAGR